MAINIIRCTDTHNTSYSASRPIKYIVLHYTAGTRSSKGVARNIAAFFAGSASGSADFIVDDSETIQYNPDVKNRYCWAVGGKKYTNLSSKLGATHYNKCTNKNSVSIEMCSRKTNTKKLLDTDTDWYLTEETVDKAVELTKYLMETYNIPVENVIMHHQVTGKICPNPWCVNNSRLSKWDEFKAKLTATETVVTEEDDEMVETGTLTVNGKNGKITKINKDGKNYISISELANYGFEIGYDPNTKNLVINNKIIDLPVKVDGEDKNINTVNIAGYNYAQLRDVAAATETFDVDFVENEVVITSKEENK